jgi:hypothetical protein
VQVKRNGATVKSWAGLTGEQNLSWDGKQNGQVLSDGNYRIVAMTEKQRDRVRGEKMVVLDNTAPSLRKADIVKKSGQGLITATLYDIGSKIDWNSPQFSLSEAVAGVTTSFPEKQTTEHNLGSVDNVFLERLRSRQVQVRLRVSDRAGNVLDTPLDDFGVKITLSSVEFLEDKIVLKGKVKDQEQNFDIYSLKADFFDDVVVLKQEVVSATASGEFTIEVTEYDFADALQDKIDNSNQDFEEYPISAKVSSSSSDFRTQAENGRSVVSNIKKGHAPVIGFELETTATVIENGETSSTMSLSENTGGFSVSAAAQNQFTVKGNTQLHLKYAIKPNIPIPVKANVTIKGSAYLAYRKSSKTMTHTEEFLIEPSFWKTKPNGPFEIQHDWYGRDEQDSGTYAPFGPYLAKPGKHFTGIQITHRSVVGPGNPKFLTQFNSLRSSSDNDIMVNLAQPKYPLHVPKAWTDAQKVHMYERHVMDYLSENQYNKWTIAMKKFNTEANLALKKYDVAQNHKAAAINFTNMGDLVKAKERFNAYLSALNDSATTLATASSTLKGDLFQAGNSYDKTTRSPKGSVFYSVKFSPDQYSQMAESIANLAVKTDTLPSEPKSQFVNILGWRSGWQINAHVKLDSHQIDTAYPVAGPILEGQELISYYTSKAGAMLPFMDLSYSKKGGNPEVFFTLKVVSFMENFRLKPDAPALQRLKR